jgi:xanthine dehydrogenase iron-sulfur cluster and FAD-binding subunit A
MRRFNLLEPRSIQDACEILAAEEDVKLIGGGTALLILIKHGLLLPKTLVNLKKIKGAAEISYQPASGSGLAAWQASSISRARRPFANTTRYWRRPATWWRTFASATWQPSAAT